MNVVIRDEPRNLTFLCALEAEKGPLLRLGGHTEVRDKRVGVVPAAFGHLLA